jgi:F420-0:gamma-glutamyl ligase-like protein
VDLQIDTTRLGSEGTTLPSTGNTVIDNAINSVGGGVAASVSRRIGLQDIYKAYIMNYCEAERNTDGSEDITECKGQRAMFTFNPVSVLEEELSGVTLQDLGVDLNNVVQGFDISYKIMFITYSTGIATAGLCMILALLGIFDGRLLAILNWIFAFVCSLPSVCPSSITH